MWIYFLRKWYLCYRTVCFLMRYTRNWYEYLLIMAGLVFNVIMFLRKWYVVQPFAYLWWDNAQEIDMILLLDRPVLIDQYLEMVHLSKLQYGHILIKLLPVKLIWGQIKVFWCWQIPPDKTFLPVLVPGPPQSQAYLSNFWKISHVVWYQTNLDHIL